MFTTATILLVEEAVLCVNGKATNDWPACDMHNAFTDTTTLDH